MNRYVVGVHILHSDKLYLHEIRAVSKLDAARVGLELVFKAEPNGEETYHPDDLEEAKSIETLEGLIEYMNEDALEVIELEP